MMALQQRLPPPHDRKLYGEVLNVLTVVRHDLPGCLRLLLFIAKQQKPLQHYSLEKMRKALTNHRISRKNPFCEEIAPAPWKRQRAWPWWCVAGSSGAGRGAVYRAEGPKKVRQLPTKKKQLQQQRRLPAERRSVATPRAQPSAHRASSDVMSPPLSRRPHGNRQRRRAGA
ncbi:hypothetical protein ABB37_02243 [Leptomonas pyrrhocoris]|uniref:Uncharacterized protein n=1 Tax=Leptomonas pyrrhocoris TaxID=157538 RepID=A0A0M9G7T5_LEPPY|nr:hypothetical protein ABB37_02243 [Leptomonas pyrrhocoris]XP_015662618.1 hypothetical protein ABB37_02243 [Leptomonas pyrrhocoris]XP_015662619.1 hypothetical protein ABB37_02243 [Leptomonas pyrrhocoris]KPA84178.1 hypothetical protein ABB37_02243 [Leptomonas pyrrhocoris]KPA84179.1 hypothetical protein ABB37_02243 [Leptomonas pyrrhocoris]KPA84180.1 hypothetical protein ABB37_02243 [Leptomonas pyrrhocoris]|eukprot:XP_015662617.1 hypothetical protein ABB37_02243 [Leptomonas pyrrhocoris]